MPTPTYDLIASNVLGSSAASVTFSSISGSYRDLILVAQGNNDNDNWQLRVHYNSDTTDGNYSSVNALAISSGAFSNTAGSYYGIFYTTANPAGLLIAQIMDYSATDKHKTAIYRNGTGSTRTEMGAVRWANTAAITTVAISPLNGNFTSGSSFHLFGIVS